MITNETRIIPILNQLDSSRMIDKNGDVSFPHPLGHHGSVIIRSYIRLPGRVSNTETIRIITSALFDPKMPSINVKNFKAALARAWRKHNELPEKEYYLRTSWSASPDDGLPKRIRVGTATIISSNLGRRFKQDAIIDDASKLLLAEPPKNYHPILVLIKGKHESFAFENGMLALDFIRGVINILVNRTVWQDSFGRKDPINYLLLGPIHTIHNVDGELTTARSFWYEPTYIGHSGKKLIIEDVVAFRKELRRLIRAHHVNKISEHAYDVVIRFCRALDHWDYDQSFIELWQALEYAVSSLDHKTSHEKIIERMASLWSNKDDILSMLEHLRQRRNSYVHRGTKHSDAEVLIYQLKNVLERFIIFCIYNKLRFSSTSMLFDFLDAPSNEQIEQRLRLYRQIKKFRSGSPGTPDASPR